MSSAGGPLRPVRRAVDADLATVTRLHGENFAEAWPEDYWCQQIAQPGGAEAASPLLLVSGKENELAGVLLARRIGDEAEILTIVVASIYRRQGIARQLLEGLIEELSNCLPCRLFLEVSVENAAALELYARFDFEPVGTRKAYYQVTGKAPVDARVLALDLRN